MHGDRDRIASPTRSFALAQRLRHRARVEFVTVEGKPAMLRHHRRFDGLAAAFAAETPLGDDVDGARSQRARAA